MIAWGADIGFRRVSLAGVDAERSMLHVATRATGSSIELSDPETMHALQLVTLSAAEELMAELGKPELIYVEQPTVQKKHSNEKVHYGYALVTAALVSMQLAPVDGIKVNTWKMRALGKGFGLADKATVLTWAARFGYDGDSEDEADALGIAVAGLQQLKALAEPSHTQMTLG